MSETSVIEHLFKYPNPLIVSTVQTVKSGTVTVGQSRTVKTLLTVTHWPGVLAAMIQLQSVFAAQIRK